MADEIEALKLKITELENMVKELTVDPAPVDISAEEVAAYHKVVGALRPGPIRVCSRGCSRGCARGCVVSQPCVLAAAAGDEADVEDLVFRPRPCGGRGCGRSCGFGQPCVAVAAEEGDFEGAVACRGCGRGCSYCYMAPRPCMAGAAQASRSARGGVRRFAHLGE